MDQLQAKLYKLLEELDDICTRNDIQYYLAGGTALGAIRGGGFLPWDDDIDLYITRKNWDKLVKVMETETPENRIFVCTENTELYWNPVGRYVDKNTTVMMKSALLCGKACGQLIEFFVMDPMPLGEEGKWKHRQYVKAYTELLSPYFVVGKNILSENPDYNADLYNKYYRKSRIWGRDKVLKELLEKITSVDEKDSDCYCMRWGIRTLMYGQDLLGEPRMEKFEYAMFPVPAKQEEVARIAYGDSWMYVPEGSGKVVHDLNKDLTTPFQEYVDLYMPLLNKEHLLKNYKKNKRIRAKALYRKNTFKKEFAIARAEIAAMHIIEKGYDIEVMRTLLNTGKYAELAEMLQYFYKEQFNSEIKANGLILPVSDEYLYITIMLCILQGAYYKSVSILKNREKTGEPLTEDLKKTKEMIEFCQALSVAVYDKKDVTLVESLLENNSKYEKILVDYGRAKLWMMTEKANVNEDFQAIIEEVQKQIAIFGDDGEILRFEAFALYQLDEKEKSEEKYHILIKKTRNGFVWKEAQDLFGIDAYDIVDNVDDEEDEDEEEEDVDEE